MSKLLTVVTSTYNKGERNRASIQSILDQTFTDFEYIVINDGSPDNTKEILEEFNDPRLRIIHQENQGFIKTMVSVMSKIKTPYVAIQGAGDVSLPNRFKQQVDFLNSRLDVGVVACSTFEMSALESRYAEKIQSKIGKKNYKGLKNIEYTTISQMIQNNIVDHGDAMIRMSAYHEAGGYRSFFRYCQDRDLWLRILEHHSIVKLRQELLYLKVIDPRTDIAGNPQKAEQQTFYSLFARHIAREKMNTGKDILELYGEVAFERFKSQISFDERLEVATKVFRNTVRSSLSKDEVEKAEKIIFQYIPGHPLNVLIKLLKVMNDTLPQGGNVFKFVYYETQKIQKYTRKVLRVPQKVYGIVLAKKQASAN